MRASTSTSLPFSLKVLLENLLRTEDGADITADDIKALAGWDADAEPDKEIQFTPARVIMQDFTGVPCVVDLATMREAMADLGGDPTKINPLAPAEMVIDHSVIADVFGTPEAFERNVEIEYERNRERYQFLRWGQGAFDDFKVVPPGTGIVHQVNIEHLARIVFTREVDGELQAYPDTCVGTDSHTTMVNGIGVVGWGVGGIEAEAAMLGQPVSMLIPRVVGFKLNGDLPEGATATDLVLTITEMLRKHGVVGKFVEFYGPGVSALPLANRATIGNMSPEFGSTIAVFPIDERDHQVPRAHRPLRGAARAGRGLRQGAGPLARPRRRAALLREARARPGHRRPVARRPEAPAGPGLAVRRQGVRSATRSPTTSTSPATRTGYDEAVAESFPASDAAVATATATARRRRATTVGRRRPPAAARATRSRSTLADGTKFELDHGAVTIAAITSCTNTSNPSVMIGAALLAKKAVEKGLQRKPWVKTTLAPGSKVVSDYYEKSGLTPYLDKLGFNLVGYGCTTCIGNSGPLIPEVSQAVNDNDLAVVSVLSGNRNFEGRINPDVKMNYLASPPLVVAYALAGSMDVDLFNDPLGQDSDGNDVFMKDIWPSPAGGRGGHRRRRSPPRCSTSDYADVFAGDEQLAVAADPRGQDLRVGRRSRPTSGSPRTSTACPTSRTPVDRHRGRAGAAQARRLGHHRPHQPGRCDQEGLARRQVPRRARRRAAGLQLLRLAPRQPRGDDPRHVRQHPAAQPAGAGHRGRLHPRLHRTAARSPRSSRRRENYIAAGTPLVVLSGKEYGSGSSRDWAAKGTALLGRQGRHRRVLRADPPLEPDRHGRAAAAVPRGRERRVARPDRRGDVLDHRHHRAQRRHDAEDGQGQGGRRRSSTRSSGSTPPARRTTTATAASCSTSCATCSRPEGRPARARTSRRSSRWPWPCWPGPPSRSLVGLGLGLVAAPVDRAWSTPR